MTDPFAAFQLPLAEWLQVASDVGIDWFRPAAQAMQAPIAYCLELIRRFLVACPPLAVVTVFGLLGWYRDGPWTGLFAAGSFLVIGAIGLWNDAMLTLAIVVVAVVFTTVVGLAVAIACVRSERLWAVIKVVLDVMQSTPSFVYLIPVVMLFGIGTVPGVIATMVFALPPMIKIAYLGLTGIPQELIEAGDAFGASDMQTLRRVRVPLALPAIATGLNQVIMFSLVMSTIVSMIGADGLGANVLRGVGRMDIGMAGSAGIAIALLALVLDRLSKNLGKGRRKRAAVPAVDESVRPSQIESLTARKEIV